MQPPFRLYGAEGSAFSHKVLWFLRYKGLEHTWIVRTAATNEEFNRVARLPLTPVLVEADGRALQDSTLILEKVELAHPDPAATPDSPALAYLAQLVEDYADEWVNKIGFLLRWGAGADLEANAAASIAAIYPDGDAPEGAAEQMAERMASKRPVLGATAENTPALEASLNALLRTLQEQLAANPYVLGGTPCVADFALAAQLSQINQTAKGAASLAAHAALGPWLERMTAPTSVGPFLDVAAARPFLEKLLTAEVAGAHLTWMAANASALANGEKAISVWVHGHPYAQGVQKYAGKAFQELRRRRAFKAEDADLAAILAATGCDAMLTPPTAPAPDQQEAEAPEDAAAGVSAES